MGQTINQGSGKIGRKTIDGGSPSNTSAVHRLDSGRIGQAIGLLYATAQLHESGYAGRTLVRLDRR